MNPTFGGVGPACAFAALAGGLSLLWWLDPALAYALRAEDQPIQVLTVVLYLLSAGIAVVRIGRRETVGWTAVIPMIAVVFAAEEMSWIARFQGPPRVLDVPVDAAHDLLAVIARAAPQATAAALALSCGAACAVAMGGVRLRRQPAGQASALRYLALAFALLCLAQLTDILESKSHFQKYFLEELPENLAALAMVFSARAIPTANDAPGQRGPEA